MSEIQNSLDIINFFNKKYGEPLGNVGLIKAVCVGSTLIPNIKPLSTFIVSFTQSFKSRTSIDIKELFKDKIVQLGSDFTIHSLMKKYNEGKDLKDKIADVNDLTVLFSTKGERTKNRLLGAFSESLSEGEYSYSDFQTDIKWKPDRWGIIGNITFERYETNKEFLRSSTLEERFLKFFYKVPIEVFEEFNKNKNERFKMKMKLKDRITKLKNYKDDKETTEKISEVSKYIKFISKFSSTSTTHDKVKSFLLGNSALNKRNYIIDKDFEILNKCTKLMVNPFEKTIDKIAELYREGKTQNEITDILGLSKSSQPYVSLQIKKLRLRGVID